jgi:DNA primase
MAGLVLPEAPGDLIVATDGDPAGRHAGDRLAHRAFALGWTVSLLPAPDGTDWNDQLRKGIDT